MFLQYFFLPHAFFFLLPELWFQYLHKVYKNISVGLFDVPK